MNARINKELTGVARLVAQRVAESPYRDEADHYTLRAAIYAVFIYDKPELEATLDEIERRALGFLNGKEERGIKRIGLALLRLIRKGR